VIRLADTRFLALEGDACQHVLDFEFWEKYRQCGGTLSMYRMLGLANALRHGRLLHG
jgi:hypothetical protein